MIKKYILLSLISISLIGISLFIIKSASQHNEDSNSYKEIITENKGYYVVKNIEYTGTILEVTELEKVMKQIRSGCKKQCKINLYSDRKAYELDIMTLEDNFPGYTDNQRSYLKTHLLAFWGIDKGDNIEYYPFR